MSNTWSMLPDGTRTNSIKQYIVVWKAIGNSVCKLLGPRWYLQSFDPDIHIIETKSGYLSSMDVDRRLALAIHEQLMNKEEHNEIQRKKNGNIKKRRDVLDMQKGSSKPQKATSQVQGRPKTICSPRTSSIKERKRKESIAVAAAIKNMQFG